jgi:RNA polymerase-binding transcription factor
MEQAELERIRKALSAELAAIDRQLADYGGGVDSDGLEVSMDEGFADSAQVTAERSELLSLANQQKEARDEIVAALRRIDEGTYGKCERCGEDIPVERLEAIPTARLCVKCKQATNHG